jgi:NRAMP (natural resistance-associated macrophage protein)-like metal ion transporter
MLLIGTLAGLQFEYNLLYVIIFSNIVAWVFQYTAARLSLITGQDLAEMCHREFPRWLQWVIYLTNMLSVMLVDLRALLGSAIALHLLAGTPMTICITLSIVSNFILAYVSGSYKSRWSVRLFEYSALTILLVLITYFFLSIDRIQPSVSDLLHGLIPKGDIFTDRRHFYMMLGIFGAAFTPHSLFLHSHAVAKRFIPDTHAQHTNTYTGSGTRFSTLLKASIVDHRSAGLEEVYFDSNTDNHLEQANVIQFIRRALRRFLFEITVAYLLVATCGILFMSTVAAMFSRSLRDNEWPIMMISFKNVHALMNEKLDETMAVLFVAILFINMLFSANIALISGQALTKGIHSCHCRSRKVQLAMHFLVLGPVVGCVYFIDRHKIPTALLIIQSIIGFLFPFAVIPLLWFTGKHTAMKRSTTSPSLSSSPTTAQKSPRIIPLIRVNSVDVLSERQSNEVMRPSEAASSSEPTTNLRHKVWSWFKRFDRLLPTRGK